MAAALERALGPAAPGRGSEAALPPLPVLVLGPAGSGRTSLLLRTALAGGADGPRALFLAPSAVPRLPGGPGGPGTDPRALQRLQLRYPRSRLSLCRELLSLSLSPSPPPSLLLLDGLERYLCPSPAVPSLSPAVPSRLAALLLELARAPRRCPQCPRGVPAQVVAALRLPPPGPRVLGALLRFFPARCHLRPDSAGDTAGDSDRRHRHVRVTLRCPGSATRRWRLRLGDSGDGDSDSGGDSDGDGEGDSDWDSPGDNDGDSDGDNDGDSGSEEEEWM
ncbi:ATPase SWSAP1 [Zonotrichia leucophrys gambelii]|uniref:ATPase SWSAP1 n=1 Tax=Zonotrichia leucophrys gambelii TaxID=257770 RepID=UPI00313FE472